MRLIQFYQPSLEEDILRCQRDSSVYSGSYRAHLIWDPNRRRRKAHQQNYIRLAGLAGLGPDWQNLSEIQICQKLIRIWNYGQNLETISYFFIFFRNQSLSSFHCFSQQKMLKLIKCYPNHYSLSIHLHHLSRLVYPLLFDSFLTCLLFVNKTKKGPSQLVAVRSSSSFVVYQY